MSALRRAVRLAGPPVLTCPDCQGAQEVGTHQDWFGTWETRPCPTCRADGFMPAADVVELLADRAAAEAERLAGPRHRRDPRQVAVDASGEEGVHLCAGCRQEWPCASVADPWTAGWPSGWEAIEPPF